MRRNRISPLAERIARNDDPLKKKKMWIKSFTAAAILAAIGVFVLLCLGRDFLVFGCVLLAVAAFILVDGLVTKSRK